jgi:ABC-type transporter Mla subunit MlaD
MLDTARTQALALARLPGVAVEAVEELRDAARSMRRVAERIDGILDDVEQPVRNLAPTLRRVARLLDDPIVAEAPETLIRVRDELLPALRTLRDTQQRVASIASSTDRITTLIDETSGRLAALPTAAALLMRRSSRTVPETPAAAGPAPAIAPLPEPPVEPTGTAGTADPD